MCKSGKFSKKGVQRSSEGIACCLDPLNRRRNTVGQCGRVRQRGCSLGGRHKATLLLRQLQSRRHSSVGGCVMAATLVCVHSTLVQVCSYRTLLRGNAATLLGERSVCSSLDVAALLRKRSFRLGAATLVRECLYLIREHSCHLGAVTLPRESAFHLMAATLRCECSFRVVALTLLLKRSYVCVHG